MHLPLLSLYEFADNLFSPELEPPEGSLEEEEDSVAFTLSPIDFEFTVEFIDFNAVVVFNGDVDVSSAFFSCI